MTYFTVLTQMIDHEYDRLGEACNCTNLTLNLMSVTGYVALLTSQVMCREFSQCYNDTNICLWTDGTALTQSAAQIACQQRNSFLPRIINSNIQSKLAEFRSAAGNLLGKLRFWIGPYVDRLDSFRWIDGSNFTGWFMSMHEESGIVVYRSRKYRCLTNSV